MFYFNKFFKKNENTSEGTCKRKITFSINAR